MTVLDVYNVWNVLYKNQKYKTRPMLLFYIFASVAITLRFLRLIFFYSANPILSGNIDFVQQVAKLCVGLV